MAAAILSVVGSIVGVVLNQLWNPIKQQLCYCATIHRNVQDLQEATKALQDERDDTKDAIAGAERKFAAPTRRVQGWLGLVDEAESKAAAIVKQYDDRRPRRRPCSLNCWSDCAISRRAQKQLKRVRELRDGGAFDAVTAELPPDQSFREVPVAAARGVRGMEASLAQALAFVRDDDGDGMLGIWGMGGVGKTTLLKQIHNSCVVGDPAFGFDHVVFIVASRECTVAKVQKDVASNLGLPTRDGERAQAAVIFNFLKNKSFLLLLDDLWRRLDLESVGIPQPLGAVGELRRKMILTTRNEVVCANMEAREKIKVECLKEEDAWRLFEAKAGEDVINSHPQIQKLAKEVVAECGGLPLALITVGRAMSAKRSPEEWENAVDLLKMSWLPDIPGTEKDTFSLLKFSYDNLESETMRRCFLCCALWPEDCNISKDELIQCWMGFGLIDEFSDIDGAYRMGYSVVGGLQAACMLEPGDDDQTLVNMHVKMHDLIRDMALWIASDCGENKSKWLVRVGIGLQEAPADDERWLAAQRVSLMNNNLQAFLQPSDIVCPNLTVLMLQNNHNLPIGIFETVANFRELTYLDLQATYLRSFPVEICRLVKLQHLNLSSTGIAALPVELGNLVNLKYLFLRENLTLKTLPQNLMLQLRRLRVLDLFLTDIDHREDIPYLATLITDLEGMNARMRALGICVQTVSDIRRIAALPGTRTKSLCLHKLEGVTSLDILSAHSLEHRNIQMSLKELVIAGCGNLAEVIAEGGPRDQDRHLPRLEFLRFKYLGSLQRIVWRRAGLYLREVTISHCHTLEHVTWVRDLPCLEYLDVRQCRRMKRVVGDLGEIVEEEAEAEAEAASAPTLPRLKKLMLWGLPELESVCDRATFFPELRIINVVWCPKVREIMITPHRTQSKMRLYCEAEWWANLDWGDVGAKTYFIPFFIEDD